MDVKDVVATLPSDFPYRWCSDYGEDEYGVFMGITYKGVRQGFRWIPPGTFMMGSPIDEEGRYDGNNPEGKETLHEVTLTRGYWLADTTCTQSFWQVVMNRNPSLVKGEKLPVEQVSWEDVQSFIQTLNANQSAFGLRLPTEAEWERACRANTQTAFWFGKEIDPKYVHFYKGGETGSLAAKALVPNPWGLYQMHGNVRELCQDRLAPLPSQAVSDPMGPEKGQDIVLRGGSWDYVGRFCRSAVRDGIPADAASRVVGFRLARSP